ncbi:hypothetical protein [Aestuariivita sp.]|jgi:hypothetical protein|uniref:hypothetical protein n=1 Tax=Aestuariivita sp. TaxID=1872407 RepID=UPI00216DDCBA|nr:hypothetical protein [Aestuariivita sp.]MCE8009604.1 hypothetical protein [Aestuariivita sp.]
MDEFSTSRPAHPRGEGTGFWTLGAVLVVLVLVIAIIGLGSAGGSDDPAAVQDPAAASTPAPIISE